MGLVSFPSTLCYNAIVSNSLPIISQASNIRKFSPRKNVHLKACVLDNFHSKLLHQPWVQTSFSSRHSRGLSLVPFDAKTPRSGEEDHQALETVLKLYSVIKSKNIRELSDIIAEECRCVCNFISFFQPFHGKRQVLDFFTYLIGNLGDNIEFVVKPTIHDGMNVGVQWKLEWRNTNTPLGQGFSFHTCHRYQGKVVIRNVEMFMEPLLHIEPLRLKIMTYAMTIMDKMSPDSVFKGNIKKPLGILLALLVMAAIMFFLKPRLHSVI